MGAPRRSPPYLALSGPGWDIRRGRAPPRARCAPGRRSHRHRHRLAPAPAAALALHGARGLALGPEKRVQLAAAPLALASPQWLPRLLPPRVRAPVLSGRPFPSAPPDRPNWFLRSGVVSPVSLRQPRRGWGWGRARPSALPLSLPGAERGWTGSPWGGYTRPRSCLAPSVRAGGRWAPRPSPERVAGLARPATWQLLSLSASPAPPPPWGPRSPPRPTSLASFSRRPPPAWPPPGVGDRASPESWPGRGLPGT